MKSPNANWARIGALALLAALGVAWARSERVAPPSRAVPANRSSSAPALTVRTAQGDSRLSDLRGKVVLVDFWATWCPPCRESIPHVADLYRRYHARGLEVLGVSLDDSDSAVQDFARKENVPYPVGRPDDESVVGSYGAESIPTMVLVDRQGRVRWRQTGFGSGTEQELAAQVDALLKE